MLLLALVTTALGADLRIPATFAEGTGVVDLAIAGEDNRFVLFVEAATGEARVFDTATWESQGFSACAGAATAVAEGSSSPDRLFVGCDDGSLTWISVADNALTLSGARVSASASQPVLGVVVVEGTLLAVAGNADGGSFEVFAEGAPEGLSSGDTLVSGTSFSAVGFEDLAPSGQYAMLSQGSTFANRLTVTGGVQPNDSAAGVVDLGDAMSTTTPGGSVQALFADPGSGSVVRFDQSLLDLFAVLTEDDGLVEASAVALLDGQLVVADSGAGAFTLFDHDSATGLPGRSVLRTADFPRGDFVNELVSLDGYAIASTRSGELWVLTDRPWVDLSTDDETTVVEGAVLTLAASVDTSGTYRLLLNPTGDTGGTVLASGTMDADEGLVFEVAVDGQWQEGTNQVRLVATDGEDDLTGHDAVLVNVDSPPGAVALTSRDLRFGDGALYLTIPALTESDLASFEVYVSTTPFSEDEWNDCGDPACGGPPWDGETSLSTPVVVDATPGAAVEVTLAPLENDRTHYLAVRAIDEGGLEGSMSNVVSGNPTETFSASELAGEQGGLSCAATGGRGAGLLAGLFSLAAVGRRRSRGPVALLAASAVGLVSLDAHAVSPKDAELADETVLPKVSFKPQGFGNLRLGSLQHEDQSIGQPYDTSLFLTLLEGGVRLTRFVEVGGGVGWSQEKGFLVSSSGVSSGDETKLQVLPLTATGTFRLDILREQFVVPYVSGGLDLWLWREVWDIDREAGTSDTLSGSKNGTHTAFGLQILLDKLDKRRSSLIEARRGIADSYLTFEYRLQTVGESGDQSGLTFSGSMFNAGLSIAY